LSVEQFLAAHWQKRPLLVRGALERPPALSAGELAGLACETEVESRLVLERRGPRPRREVRHGPFARADFAGLPRRRWTLLVQGVDRHVGPVADLLGSFRFIPNWRIDDVMVSFAAPEGGVGAHVDSYDVFLLQGRGRRRWRIRRDPVEREVLSADHELRILADFEPDAEWVLEPGDMLYLPPRVAHEGVALEPCMTFSVGFRAPSHAELLRGVAGHAAEALDPDLRYRDPDLRRQGDPGLIGPEVIAATRQMLREALLDAPGVLEAALGCFLTAPGRDPQRPDPPYTGRELVRLVREGGQLQRLAPSLLASIPLGAGRTRLFVGGRSHDLGAGLAFAAPLLCGTAALDAAALGRHLARRDLAELLAEICNAGFLVPQRARGGRRRPPRPGASLW
jgi:50S ribosomal protein L16 3-hydroxylase